LRPDYAQTYEYLANTLRFSGDLVATAAVYRRWLEKDSGNPIATHMLAGCTGKDIPERSSDAYLRQTFDNFASNFDKVLNGIEYQGPIFVTEAVIKAFGQLRGTLDVLDAG
jgi:predicted TPR repeat methyltransferase